MGRELSASFYNIALALVAAAYILLVMALMTDQSSKGPAPQPAAAFRSSPGAGSESLHALDLASKSAGGLGLTETPSIESGCKASGSGFLCSVTGFTRAQGGDCTVYVLVEGTTTTATVRNFSCR